MKCRACGALLVTPPIAPGRATAPEPVPALVGSATAQTAAPGTDAAQREPAPAMPDDRFFAPATFTPVTVTPPVAGSAPKRGPMAVAVVVVAIVVLAGAGYAAIKSMSSSGSADSSAPVALPPVAESEGLPGLADALRVQAEASRQRAFVVIAQAMSESTGGAVTPATLQQYDPSLEWVVANASSTGPKVVSFSQSGDIAIVAVANNTGDVCAYGRLPLAGVGEYVTLANVKSCRAADAPASGWTQLAPVGGSRSEPPADLGY
jgi:hypothetical protein